MKIKNHHFTLVEIMVAMAILVILMGFLFEFIIGAQEIWSSSRKVASLYDRAHIALKWLEDDMQNALFQKEEEYPGRKIIFKLQKGTGNSFRSLQMLVSRLNVNELKKGADEIYTHFIYVEYQYVAEDKTLYRIEKLMDDASYNFKTGAMPALAVSSSLTTDSVFLEGVDRLDIITDVAAIGEKPSLVKLEMDLFDPEILSNFTDHQASLKTETIKKNSRTFSKIIFLDKRQI